MKVLEIERRFLLKNLPKLYEDKLILIEQFYTPTGERFRKSFLTGPGNKWKYERIIKKNVGRFTNEEESFECSQKDYLDNYATLEKIIHKQRHVFNHEGLNFEIDEFLTMKLIICEVELKEEGQEINFPPQIKDQIIMEVTGIKEFSNYQLANNLK